MPKGYVIDAAGIQKLREDHEILRKMILQMQQKITGTVGAGIRSNIAYARVTQLIRPASAIGDFSSGWVGGGKARILNINKHFVYGSHEDDRKFNETDNEVDVYNTSRVSIPVDANITIQRDFTSGLWMAGDIECAIGKTNYAGITPRVGNEAGNGLVNFYYIDVPVVGTAEGTLTDAGFPVYNVWNLSRTSVAANTFVTLKRVAYANQWIVDAEDCG